jgi:hypothetical protein
MQLERYPKAKKHWKKLAELDSNDEFVREVSDE